MERMAEQQYGDPHQHNNNNTTAILPTPTNTLTAGDAAGNTVGNAPQNHPRDGSLRFVLSEDERVSFEGLVRLCAQAPLEPCHRYHLPRAVMHSLAALAASSAAETVPSPYPPDDDGRARDAAWLLHSDASRAGCASVAEAWQRLMQEPLLGEVTERTRWGGLTLFCRFLAVIAAHGQPLHDLYDQVRGQVSEHRRAITNTPPPTVRRQFPYVGDAAPAAPAPEVRRAWGQGETEAPPDPLVAAGSPQGATSSDGNNVREQQTHQQNNSNNQQRNNISKNNNNHNSNNNSNNDSRRDSYSIYLCMRECLLVVCAVLEIDLHVAVPEVFPPRSAAALCCTRFILRVLGYCPVFTTPHDAVDAFFYTAVPRTALRRFAGIAALQRVIDAQHAAWAANCDFGLAPAAPIAGMMLTRGMRSLLDPSDVASAAMLDSVELLCRAAAHTMRSRVVDESGRCVGSSPGQVGDHDNKDDADDDDDAAALPPTEATPKHQEKRQQQQ